MNKMPALTKVNLIRALAYMTLALQVSLSLAAEDAKLMERWLVNDPLSTRYVDHSLWAELLEAYVKQDQEGHNIFDYAGVDTEDRVKLDTYIRQLERTDVDRLSRDEQLAFWINAFNALCVRFVLDEYPVRSINDLDGSFFSAGPWNRRVFKVYSIDLSLNDIYHRILRPIWQDERIHYVLACTAKSCADIVAYPYTGPTINRAMEVAATNFVNTGLAVIDIKREAVRVSSIYTWYQVDFGDSEAAILLHLQQFAEGDLAEALNKVVRISGYGFDWSLNDGR